MYAATTRRVRNGIGAFFISWIPFPPPIFHFPTKFTTRCFSRKRQYCGCANPLDNVILGLKTTDIFFVLLRHASNVSPKRWKNKNLRYDPSCVLSGAIYSRKMVKCVFLLCCGARIERNESKRLFPHEKYQMGRCIAFSNRVNSMDCNRKSGDFQQIKMIQPTSATELHGNDSN